MQAHTEGIERLNKQITDLSDTLAHLGKGSDLHDLLRIIVRPGWTTPAELAFATTIVDAMHNHAAALTKLSGQLLKASRLVGAKERAAVSNVRA
jgi:hypothetical protein